MSPTTKTGGGASRQIAALAAARRKEGMARDLSGFGLRVIQINGIRMDADMTLAAATRDDATGGNHPLLSSPLLTARRFASFA
jgi:hypothetical protein